MTAKATIFTEKTKYNFAPTQLTLFDRRSRRGDRATARWVVSEKAIAFSKKTKNEIIQKN